MATSNIAVSILSAEPKPWYVRLTLNVADPNTQGSSAAQLNYIEVTYSAVNDRSLGQTFQAQLRTAALHLNIADGGTFFYWVRAIDNSGNAGDYFPASANAGVQVIVNPTPASGFSLSNGKISVTTLGGALTVAVKDSQGNDPTALNPVLLPIVDTNGGVSTLAIVAPLSFTLSPGSTAGFLANTPSELWYVAFNNGGTVGLGAFNRVSGALIYPLAEQGVASAIAEGGAGAADSAGVIYAGSTLSNIPYRIIGYSIWTNGLAVPGTWTAPSRTILYGAGSAGLQFEPPAQVISTAAGVPARFGFGLKSPADLSNISLSVSAAANVLTCALKMLDGTDPSAVNPLTVAFQPGDGSVVYRQLTAGLSLALPNTSSFGMPAGAEFRIWWVIVDNAGVLSIAAIRTVFTTTPVIEGIPATVTALPATGGGVLYGASAIGTARAFRVLGCTIFQTGVSSFWTMPADALTLPRFEGMKLLEPVSVRASIGTSGYLRDPSGLILQWGQATGNSGMAVNYPIPFPTNVFAVTGSVIATPSSAGIFSEISFAGFAGPNIVYGFNAYFVGVTFSPVTAGQSNGNTIMWIAVGW